MKRVLSVLLLQISILSIFSGFFLSLPSSVEAVAAGDTYIRCDRMKAATDPGNCLVVFTTSATSATETTIKITLDSEWESGTHFSTTAGNYTVATSGTGTTLPAGVTAMPGISTADNVTGNTIRFPVTAMADSTRYGFYITGTGLIANPAASTTIVHTVFTRTGSDAATADTKDVAVPVIADDQIAVTASVAPTFTMTFGTNTQALGTLSTSSVISGSGASVTLVSNAPGGWFVWVKDLNEGLTSANASKTIATTGTLNDAPSSLSAGTEGYVLDVDLTTDAGSGGTVTIAAEYLGADTSSGGTLDNENFQLAASSDGTANSDVITLIPRAAISGLTPAASDYVDTITVVGAGEF